MADTNFVDQSTIIQATWLNEVNNLVHKIFGNPTYSLQAVAIDGNGNFTFSKNVTVEGAFTSVGIDDNATSTAITIGTDEKVGIGIASPDQTLHVYKGSAGTVASSTDSVLTLENSGNAYLQILTPNTGLGQVRFGDPENNGDASVTYNHSTRKMILATAAADAITIDSSQQVGIGIATPDSVLHVWKGTAGTVTGSANAPLVIESDGPAYINFLTTSANQQGFFFGDPTSNAVGRLLYSHVTDAMTLYTDSTVRMTITAGVIIGSPTGGDKGAGTLNASAVYDDNTLLTCYVLDQAVDGDIDLEKWDEKVPNVETTDPGTEEVSIEERTHIPAKKFKARLATKYNPLDIDKYSQHWKDKKHLTSMPNEARFEPADMSSGEWIQRLVETVEIQAIHIDQLNTRLKSLETQAKENPISEVTK